MRRRPTRRSTTRRTRRRRSTKNSPEVKYLTLSVPDLASKISCTAGQLSTLFNGQNKFTDMLSYLAQGVGRDNRIGGKVYMKFATFHLWTRACPNDPEIVIDHYYLRCIVSNTGNTRIAQNNQITEYFGSAERRNINGVIDRSKVTVYHDKIYKVVSGGLGTTALDSTIHCGPSRRISFTVPIGHVVDYLTDSTTVRNDRDYMCLMLIVGVPGMESGTDQTQIACTDISVRFYYTDA